MKEKIRILPTGILNKNGFTLIELTVVIVLVGIMLLVAAPKIHDTLLSDGLQRTTGYLLNTIKTLRNEALRNQVDYILHIDIDKRSLWITAEDMSPEKRAEAEKHSYFLAQEVKIIDICLYPEIVKEGEAAIRFFKQDYVQPSIIHLRQGEKIRSLVLRPFLHETAMYAHYIE